MLNIGRHGLEGRSAREWLLTNGIGGYASGTVSDVLTRRYHGLLVAPLQPPLGRFLLFAKADARLTDGESETPLHTNLWGSGAVDPAGHCLIEDFRLEDGLPVWRYVLNGLRIERRIWMRHGDNSTQVAYRLVEGEPAETRRIRLDLIASYRDHHCVNRPRAFRLGKSLLQDGLRLALPDGRVVGVRSRNGRFELDDTWIESFFLAVERERGLEDIDAHLRVGSVEIPLVEDRWTGISICLDGDGETDLDRSLAAEQRRIAGLRPQALPDIERTAAVPRWVGQLVTAADAYVFRRQGGDDQTKTSVMAGYPWFGDWGRDTMIALPGLTLAAGRPALAREILKTYTGFLSEGMVPNCFPGTGGTPEYNTVDAALWLVEAWRAYYASTRDLDAVEAALSALTEVIDAYRQGTRYGIGMDPSDGLIRAGTAGQQLTWMDARVDGREITPRHGKPVEISALWYNALRSMALMAHALGKPAAEYEVLADRTAAGFPRFHRGGAAGLFDVLDGPEGNDAAIRPNQILAVSLPFSPLSDDALQRAVVEECRAQLLTPYGLRSLSPEDSRYSGRYLGSVRERDGTYHQGPVWGWLLGHFAVAEYRVTGDAEGAQLRLEPMANHLKHGGLGHISEIFDGESPHAPRGAPAQAWSVACTLHAWWYLELEKARTHAA